MHGEWDWNKYHTAIKKGGEGSGRGPSGAHVYQMCRKKKAKALPSCLPQACGKFSLVDTQIPLTKWLGADGTDSVLIASSFVLPENVSSDFTVYLKLF